ncbi:MAG: TasA family protein [Symbiobacterium sp.]|uniref:TasA family protein n=1 Tax=Symbiobacterium sp. TaxID=1971213 RepID=UPI0034646A3B
MKKIALSLATVGALSALITGASFALFTAESDNVNNTLSAGTVELGEVTSFSCGVSTDNLAPGDSGSCTVSVTYVGSLEAFIGVEYEVDGELFDGDNPLAISLSGGNEVDGHYVLGKFSDGQTATVTVNYQFPIEAGNEYQGAEGEIDLFFKAVQARNNTKPDGSGPSSWN